MHIIYLQGDTVQGTGSNISNSHVYQAITSLNRKFAGYDITDARAVNTGIQFFLAPVGADSNGIVRYESAMSNHHYNDMDTLYRLIAPEYRTGKYLNVFIVNKLITPEVGGYAAFPNMLPRTEGSPYNMVVISRRQFGDYNTCSGCDLASTSTGKTTAHEIGHFLGLYHTHQDGCSETVSIRKDCGTEGDECCDTPPCVVDTTCNSTNTCSEFPNNPDQKENLMSYSPQSCTKWFTRNQAERMHYTLEHKRPDLINIDWLIDLDPDICLFSARFKLSGNLVCDTGTVSFTAIPYTNTGVAYIWTILDSAQAVVLDTLIADQSTFQFSTLNYQLSKGFSWAHYSCRPL